MSQHVLTYREEKLTYILERNRRSRQLRMSLRKNLTLRISAPHFVSAGVIHRWVEAQAEWIWSQIAKYREQVALPKPVGYVQPSYAACKGRAMKLIKERIAHYHPHYGFPFQKVVVRNTISRWGSCSKQGNLNFSYRLLFLPLELVDYVVVHELCHLRELNHSKRFWALVAQMIPDYLSRRRILREQSH